MLLMCLVETMTPRIIGGVEAQVYAFPFAIPLLQTIHGSLYHICGAVVISDAWAITAAHCIDPDGSYSVAVWEHNLNVVDGPCSEVIAVQPIVHPLYHYPTLNVDMALLRLASLPKCHIPPPSISVSHARMRVQIAGWGYGNNPSSCLSVADTTILDMTACKLAWGKMLSPTQLCAGFGNDTCIGDSGGPLFSSGDGVTHLHGITSYGADQCNHPTIPGVYTNLYLFTNWIYAHTRAKQSSACKCVTESETLPIRCVDHHNESSRWCYVQGGLRCIIATPSALHQSEAWIWCNGPAHPPPLPSNTRPSPPPQPTRPEMALQPSAPPPSKSPTSLETVAPPPRQTNNRTDKESLGVSREFGSQQLGVGVESGRSEVVVRLKRGADLAPLAWKLPRQSNM